MYVCTNKFIQYGGSLRRHPTHRNEAFEGVQRRCCGTGMGAKDTFCKCDGDLNQSSGEHMRSSMEFTCNMKQSASKCGGATCTVMFETRFFLIKG